MLTTFYSRPILLLILTALFWAGNTIAGRLAIGEVSPFVVVTLRWVIVSGLLMVFFGRQVVAEWATLRRHMIALILMAIFGLTAFNSLFYVAAHSTTALNLGIIQGSMPIFVLVGALVFHRTPVGPLQIAGVMITMLGVIYISAHGDLARLAELEINPGDGLMIIACVFYSAYAVTLRNRPKVPGIVFFTMLSVIAAITSLPALGYEIANGTVQWPTPEGWLIVLYIALGPSFLSQIFFMRGVELIGPGRAGVFINLVPIFSSIMAVVLLSEPFQSYHAVALALVFAGIWLSERRPALREAR
ncbi:DMT family transporter [Stappia sp. F7233]|uniref:DMT family transporter n=1 Tax=Stappia albiluteola TaxID=2758565 RepID=A0A839AK04_9HYPH|nr:DMT family transporter [Stappia albiluteola]MBA5779107.1 DMT family transporter [Stappia albiluteola]